MAGTVVEGASCRAASPAACVRLDRRDLDAVILDLDGVLTDTASVHEAAWSRVFDAFLARRAAEGGHAFEPFTTEEYRSLVDGRPRHEGIVSFMRARGIHLPWGDRNDPPGAGTVLGLGRAKNEAFNASLERQGVHLFPSSRDLLRRLRKAGLAIAIVTASRNAPAVVRAAGLTDLFDVLVDGNMAAELRLAGKPAPDAMLEATGRLGIAPDRAAVVEDAAAGVAAARAGGFARVIGIDLAHDPDRLFESGADAVVSDLAAIKVTGEPEDAAMVPAAPTDSAGVADLLRGRQPALFLDYDGTLTPIVDRPDLAVLSDEMRAVLAELTRYMTICIVSGREREDLARLVRLDGVVYAGAHGFDIAGPAGSDIRAERGTGFRGELAAAARRLRDDLAAIDGVLVEDKRFAVAVHYRLVDEGGIAAVHDAVTRAMTDFPRLRRTEGKMVVELRPDIAWDKGRAVLWLLGALSLEGAEALPVYIGDDVTDEDAFVALRDRGLTILVAEEPRPTAAQYRLGDPAAVQAFLSALAEVMERVDE